MEEKLPPEAISTIDRLQNLVNSKRCDLDIPLNPDNTERKIYTVEDVRKAKLEHDIKNQVDNAEQTVTVNGTGNKKENNPDAIWREVDGECLCNIFRNKCISLIFMQNISIKYCY